MRLARRLAGRWVAAAAATTAAAAAAAAPPPPPKKMKKVTPFPQHPGPQIRIPGCAKKKPPPLSPAFNVAQTPGSFHVNFE